MTSLRTLHELPAKRSSPGMLRTSRLGWRLHAQVAVMVASAFGLAALGRATPPPPQACGDETVRCFYLRPSGVRGEGCSAWIIGVAGPVVVPLFDTCGDYTVSSGHLLRANAEYLCCYLMIGQVDCDITQPGSSVAIQPTERHNEWLLREGGCADQNKC